MPIDDKLLYPLLTAGAVALGGLISQIGVVVNAWIISLKDRDLKKLEIEQEDKRWRREQGHLAYQNALTHLNTAIQLTIPHDVKMENPAIKEHVAQAQSWMAIVMQMNKDEIDKRKINMLRNSDLFSQGLMNIGSLVNARENLLLFMTSHDSFDHTPKSSALVTPPRKEKGLEKS